MKNDVTMYEKIYQILRNKIECGLLPGGMKLPSRADLCREFDTSEKTVRHVMSMLVRDGLVETAQRRRPTVAYNRVAQQPRGQLTLKKADAHAANDVLKTGILLCYPLNRRGMELCRGGDWRIPESIVANMDTGKPTEFWRLSNRLWQFFISRNGNELILRVVLGLGFSELDPLPGTLEIREHYRKGLTELIQTMKRGENPENVHFDDLFVLYGFLPERGMPEFHVPPDSIMCLGIEGLEPRLSGAQERYSSIYLDLLGLIAVGRYRQGDRLPSHEELQEIYDVSIDTTVKAVQTLQEWGVVTAKRGKGIFVEMDQASLKKIRLDRDLVACHVRRFLDTLELLSLTIEGVAAHMAAHATAEEARELYGKIESLWNEEYLYQLSPIILLEFIVEHIQYDALRAVYKMICKNYHIGRSIPELVNRKKLGRSCEIYQQCMEAVSFLIAADGCRFAKTAAAMFQHTHRIVIGECKKLGYWEAAMRVYDGTALWK